jgi:hypothetical protein
MTVNLIDFLYMLRCSTNYIIIISWSYFSSWGIWIASGFDDVTLESQGTCETGPTPGFVCGDLTWNLSSASVNLFIDAEATVTQVLLEQRLTRSPRKGEFVIGWHATMVFADWLKWDNWLLRKPVLVLKQRKEEYPIVEILLGLLTWHMETIRPMKFKCSL